MRNETIDIEKASLIVNDQDDPENIETQHTHPMELPPEQFYANSDSIYIRVKWDEAVQGFSVTVRNELWYTYNQDPNTIPDHLVRLSAFVRGMIELGMAFPSRAYNLGVQAVNNDVIDQSEGLSDLQKDLLRGEPKGRA